MGKIRNTSAKNVYGDGYQQEITFDNGDTYIVRNTSAKNVYGDGYQKQIIRKNNSGFLENIIEIAGVLMGILLIGGLFKLIIYML